MSLKPRKPEAKVEMKKTARTDEVEKSKTHQPKVIVHSTPVRTEVVSRLAFQLFEQRGCVHGYDVHDWLEAERQISEESLN